MTSKIALRFLVIACCAVTVAFGAAQSSPQALFRIQNAADAQTTSSDAAVAPPILNFVVDGAQAIRPVIGIAGSASILNPLDLGFPVVRAAVSAGQDYILVTPSEGAWPALLQIRGGTIMVRPIGNFAVTQRRSVRRTCDEEPAIDLPMGRRPRVQPCATERSNDDVSMSPSIDRIVLSPTGSAAALFSSAQGAVYALTNLAQSPVLNGRFAAGGVVSPTALAISDDGRSVLAGVSNGDSGGLFLLTADQPARLIASMQHPSAITFLHNSDSAVIADDVENKVYILSQGQLFALATAENGVANPVGIGVSNDNQRVFIGNQQSGSVMAIAANGAIEGLTSCNCTLTGLYATKTDSVFRVTDFSGGPLLLFDGSAATPRIVIVPMSSSRF